MNKIKQQNIPRVYKKFCSKCGVYFQPETKFSKVCDSCKVIIKQEASKKSSVAQRKNQVKANTKRVIAKLTKKQKLINKKEKHKLTKTYALKQAKKLLKQQDRDWSAKVRELQPTCLLCGSTASLQAHHIISREFLQFRHDILNGVTLCFKCHKYGRTKGGMFSAHGNPVWFLFKLKQLQPESYDYAFEKVLKLEDVKGSKDED